MAARRAATPPGAHVDKRTTLLIDRGTDDNDTDHLQRYTKQNSLVATDNNNNTTDSLAPRCHYQNEYLEDDIHGLLSDWMEHDVQLGPSALGGVAGKEITLKEKDSTCEKGEKPKKRRLQWRAPGMEKPKRKEEAVKEVKNKGSGSSTTARKRDPPCLPPSSSSSSSRVSSLRSKRRSLRKKNKEHTDSGSGDSSSDEASVSTFRSVATFRTVSTFKSFRSSASSIFTTKSTSTQKQSNRANAKKYIPKFAGSFGSSSPSISSTTPSTGAKPIILPLRRRRRREALDAALGQTQGEKKESRTLQPRTLSKPHSSISVDSLAAVLEENDEQNEEDGSDDKTHVSFGDMKVKVTKNYESSPTSVENFPDDTDDGDKDVNTSTEVCLFGEAETTTNTTKKKSSTDNNEKQTSLGNMLDNMKNNYDDFFNANNNTGEEDTVASINSNERRPGPIDIDSCERHLTPTERRHLHAMHQLGNKHLRKGEYPQAIEIFSEILRGQKERHGKRSLQCAVAMHNLGAVCMKCNRYVETVRLCDGAARIRVEKLGRDSLDVASSLSQQGVALMELKEFRLALASFREALRIRTKAWGLVSDKANHPLIVRLYNNIGCALFEMNQLQEAKLVFDDALSRQRGLMKANSNMGVGIAKANGGDGGNNVNLSIPLSISLTLTNLGSIHLCLNEFDESLAYFEEAVLIQESVLGEKHKLVTKTKENINFVIQAQEKQVCMYVCILSVVIPISASIYALTGTDILLKPGNFKNRRIQTMWVVQRFSKRVRGYTIRSRMKCQLLLMLYHRPIPASSRFVKTNHLQLIEIHKFLYEILF